MANKFTDDDLADYDDEEYYDYVDEEQEDDKAEYNFVDKQRDEKKTVTKQPSMKNETIKPKPPIALPEPSLTSSIYTSNQIKKMVSLSNELAVPYPVSSHFLDKCVKANGLETARANINNPNVPKLGDNSPCIPGLVFVVIGHVDAGKSTLNAQLVKHFSTPVSSPKMSPKSSPTSSIVIGGPKVKTRGVPGGKSALAWELDVGSDEREHGVTIDSKSKQLKIRGKKFVAIDAPGHRDYVPSMLLGAMQADAAVLVIDASKFDSGFSRGGQTKEHVSLIRSLGIHQLIVVINKIDTIDVDDREEEIATIKVQLEDFIFDEMKFSKNHVQFVIVSALLDHNIISCEETESLENALLQLEPKNHGPVHHSICVPIVDISGNRLSGRIECGSIRSGDKLMVLPSKHLISLVWENRDTPALPGDYLESIEFTFFDKALDAGSASPGGNNSSINHIIHPGSVLVDPVFPLEKLKCSDNFFARILVINDDVMPIVKGQSVTLNVHTVMTDGYISRIVGKMVEQKLVISPVPKCLVKGDVAIVEISTRKMIPIEPDVTNRVTGRVVIRDRGTTIAAGLVVSYP